MGSSDIHFLVVAFFSSNWPVAISYFTLKETSLIEVNQRTQSDVSDEPFAGSTGGVCFRLSDNQKEGLPPPLSFISVFAFHLYKRPSYLILANQKNPLVVALRPKAELKIDIPT